MLDDLAIVVAHFVQSHFETRAVNTLHVIGKSRLFNYSACLQSRNKAKPCMDRKRNVDKKKRRKINKKKRERERQQKKATHQAFETWIYIYNVTCRMPAQAKEEEQEGRGETTHCFSTQKKNMRKNFAVKKELKKDPVKTIHQCSHFIHKVPEGSKA